MDRERNEKVNRPIISSEWREDLVHAVGRCLPRRWKTGLAARFRTAIDRVRGSDRGWLARKYLRGDGIEIGALNSPLAVPRSARVKYVDRMTVGELRLQYPELQSLDIVNTDIVTDGERLDGIGDFTQDFVIANHFLEHCQNPIGAVRNMLRVLKAGGILYLAVPDKRYTFDAARPVTTLEHLIADDEKGPGASKRQHFEEWVRLVNRIEDPGAAEQEVEKLLAKDYSIHYHVWTQGELFDLVRWLQLRPASQFDVQIFAKNEDECLFLLRKR